MDICLILREEIEMSAASINHALGMKRGSLVIGF